MIYYNNKKRKTEKKFFDKYLNLTFFFSTISQACQRVQHIDRFGQTQQLSEPNHHVAEPKHAVQHSTQPTEQLHGSAEHGQEINRLHTTSPAVLRQSNPAQQIQRQQGPLQAPQQQHQHNEQLGQLELPLEGE